MYVASSQIIEKLYKVSGKKASLLIELFVGILLKIQLYFFFQKPCI